VRFLLEPKDTYALQGQPIARLHCAIGSPARYGQRAAGGPARRPQPNWYTAHNAIVYGQRSVFPVHYSAQLAHLPLADFLPPSAANSSLAGLMSINSTSKWLADAQLGQLGEQQEVEVASYTLNVHNVTLAQDDFYSCVLRGQKSRAAHLIVVQPPGPLAIKSSQQFDTQVEQQQQQVSVGRNWRRI